MGNDDDDDDDEGDGDDNDDGDGDDEGCSDEEVREEVRKEVHEEVREEARAGLLGCGGLGLRLGPGLELGLGALRMRARTHAALIPAAGCSRRLARLTRYVPKSLLAVGVRVDATTGGVGGGRDGAGRESRESEGEDPVDEDEDEDEFVHVCASPEATLLGRSLAGLAGVGVPRAIVVAGYRHATLRAFLLARVRAQQAHAATSTCPAAVDIVLNPDYATTEHGYSVFLARAAWEAAGRPPVLFVDADAVYDWRLLALALAVATAGGGDRTVLLVDDAFDAAAHGRDEDVVLSEPANNDRALAVFGAARVRSITRGRAHGPVFVGVNRLSARFVGRMFDHMHTLFGAAAVSSATAAAARRRAALKYERVFDAMVRDGECVHCAPVRSLRWCNVNFDEDLAAAHEVVSTFPNSPRPTADESIPPSPWPCRVSASRERAL